MWTSAFGLLNLFVLTVYAIIIGLVIYTLLLAIKALKIYIQKNS